MVAIPRRIDDERALPPNDRGQALTPATDDAAAARRDRIRAIGTRLADRHESVLRKLAE